MSVARQNMVEGQIRPNKVTSERVLAAFEAIARENFLPAALKSIAYIDDDLDLTQGRSMMEPMVLARLLQAAEIEAGNRVLVVGAAGGYTAAVCSKLTKQVVLVESIDAHRKLAEKNLKAAGIKSVKVVNSALETGCKDHAPYDVILINGSAQVIPVALTDQLAPHGRLIYIWQQEEALTGQAILETSSHSGLLKQELFDAHIPPLPELSKKFKFSI